jgi:lipoyl(octanoyl) transferase
LADDVIDSGTIRWRVVETEPASGAWNMAVDEVLLESVRSGGAPTLRFYGWSSPCLSIGRNQPISGIDRDTLEELGIAVVRRLTGGRAVLHDDELTYSVLLPVTALGSPRETYRRINDILKKGLARLDAGVSTQAGDVSPRPVSSDAPCFADPVRGEVLANGRKLIGSAQVRVGSHLLQHGSLPLRPSRVTDTSGWLGAYIGTPAYLCSILHPLPPRERIIGALTAAWLEVAGGVEHVPLQTFEMERVGSARDRYESPVWTARR